MIILDFETRSRCDLPSQGTYRYVTDPSTDILCMAAVNDDTGQEYLWFVGTPVPAALVREIDKASFLVARNAEFDLGIYELIAVSKYGFPEQTLEKWYCSAAQCRVNALPAGLDASAWALGLSKRKNPQGKSLIKALSIPQSDGSFNTDPRLMQDMGRYCLDDARLDRQVVRACRLMTQREHAQWLDSVRINERGVRVDTDLATQALRYANDEQTEIGLALSQATGGVVTKHTQTVRARDWVASQLQGDIQALNIMTVYKDGEKKYSLAKDIRRELLDGDQGARLSETVHDTVALIDVGNKSSVSKFRRMLDLADPQDQRVRGAYVFAGAAATGRYASRGLQLHNMRRACWTPDQTDQISGIMSRNSPLVDELGNALPVMDTLSKLLRPAIIPAPGHVFVVGDWSSIEARVLPWLSDSKGGEARLDLFRADKDVYVHTALGMGLTDSDDDRQIGKIAELACGYQGGANALGSMARQYGVAFSPAMRQSIVDRWRGANQWAVDYWRKLETAALRAMASPGKEILAGRVAYVFVPDIAGGSLVCLLPGDYTIQYPKARIESVMTPWGEPKAAITALKAARHPKADAQHWPRGALYGGLQAENITQAVAAALLREALSRVDNVVGHVHDEIILEVPDTVADFARHALHHVMTTPPDWGQGLPLKAKPVNMRRYGGH